MFHSGPCPQSPHGFTAALLGFGHKGRSLPTLSEAEGSLREVGGAVQFPLLRKEGLGEVETSATRKVSAPPNPYVGLAPKVPTDLRPRC
jgi:hypothetical protein